MLVHPMPAGSCRMIFASVREARSPGSAPCSAQVASGKADHMMASARHMSTAYGIVPSAFVDCSFATARGTICGTALATTCSSLYAVAIFACRALCCAQ